MVYAVRSAMNYLPVDDVVVYGKLDGYSCLLHILEIAE